MRKQILQFALVMGVILAFAACGSKAPPELQKGVDVIYSMTSAKYLSQSAFYVAYPNGTPSDYVRYTFSDVGAAEWPAAEGGMGYDEMEEEQARSAGMPVIPTGVFYAANAPDPSQTGMQVVLRGDDAKGVLIVEGYVNPQEKPVIVEEMKIAKVEPSELAKMTYHSLVEQGASDGNEQQ